MRQSERANFVAAASLCGVVLGIVAGLVLPWRTWRLGGLTPLGDFALLCVLGLVVWRSLERRPSRVSVVVAIVSACVVLGGRELLWWLYPRGLGVLHGVAVFLLLAWLLGIPAYRLYRERAGFLRLLDEEDAIGVVLAALVAVWWIAGLAAAVFGGP